MQRRHALSSVAPLAALFLLLAPRPTAAAPMRWTVMVDGVQRTALVEPGRDATTTPSPLVFAFHGLGTTPQFMAGLGIAQAWPEATVVYPQGLNLVNPFGGSGRGWQSLPGETDDRDVRFVDALLKDLSATYKVDERRVYVIGFSLGGMFTHLLRTVRAERFAAFAPVAAFPLPSLKWSRVPRPVLITHGTRDTTIDPSFAAWARNQNLRVNGCGPEAIEWTPGSVSYQPCASGQPVIWSTHPGGHEWPRDATANIVRFFKEQALPAAPSASLVPEVDTRGTVAGTGQAGFAGDGALATAARLFFPESVAVDAAGSLWIADTGNSRVRRVAPDGIITTVAGSAGLVGLYQAPDREGIPGTHARLSFPEGIVLDRDGSLFIADTYDRLVRKVTPDGTIRTVAGRAELWFPAGLAVDPKGNLFIADPENHRVRRVAPDGTLTTVAGVGTPGFAGDAGPATAARLNEPWGLAIESGGNLFIADAANHRVRKVAPDGNITTVAGTGTAGFSGDEGAATTAQLDHPIGVAVDSQGSLFIVDSRNQRVRKVGANGVITTMFGGSASDPIMPAGYYPASVAVDRAGNLLIADPFHHRVWKIAGVAAPGLIAGQPFP